MRFRRPVGARRQDASRPQGYDPYRTTYGISEAGIALWVVGAILAFFILFFVVLNLLGLV